MCFLVYRIKKSNIQTRRNYTIKYAKQALARQSIRNRQKQFMERERCNIIQGVESQALLKKTSSVLVSHLEVLVVQESRSIQLLLSCKYLDHSSP